MRYVRAGITMVAQMTCQASLQFGMKKAASKPTYQVPTGGPLTLGWNRQTTNFAVSRYPFRLLGRLLQQHSPTASLKSAAKNTRSSRIITPALA